jgi:hypothetical protein
VSRRRKRPVEVFSLSFLDVVCCGFGAIILLLVLVKIAEPVVLEAVSADLSGVVADLERQLYEIRGDTTRVRRDLELGRARLADVEEELAALEAELAAVRGRRADAVTSRQTQEVIEGKLAAARQSLTEEMRRLLGRKFRRSPSDATVGGVPVDSEYVIFIIDTSGSMFENAWPLVMKKIDEVLDVYPKVKGIQVLNDMGEYMFRQYDGRWIPDTPARRRSIVKRLRSWNAFSNSSPVEGITAAIRTFYSPDKKISLYVFGDEFSGGSIEAVAQEVARLNRADASGARRVRIHGVGFPTQFAPGAAQFTGIRFAALMRVLAHRNGGTFVGLRQ